MEKKVIFTITTKEAENWLEKLNWGRNHSLKITFSEPAYRSVVKVVTSVTDTQCIVSRNTNGLYRIDMTGFGERKRNKLIQDTLAAINKNCEMNCEVHFQEI